MLHNSVNLHKIQEGLQLLTSVLLIQSIFQAVVTEKSV